MTSPVATHRWPATVRATRPKQWIKNILVLAAPLAAGSLLEPQVLVPTLLALIAFCLVSSSVYLFNDIRDLEEDRRHPTKRFRAIASGELPVRRARLAGALLGAVGLMVGLAASPACLALLVGYLALQAAYSWKLKHEPVLDLTVVAVGFLFRAVGGGVAAGIPLSAYFLLVAGFGSLFVVAGKRYSELHTLGAEAGTRRSLVRYSDSYLRFVWSLAAATTVMSYSLWAFEQGTRTTSWPWHALSIVPFVVGLMRYAVDIDAGDAAEPEDIVWGDRVLQGVAVLWLCTVVLGVLHV